MLDRFVGWWFLIVHLHSHSNKVRQVAQTPSSSGFQPSPLRWSYLHFVQLPLLCWASECPPVSTFWWIHRRHWAVCSTSPPKMDAFMCFFFTCHAPNDLTPTHSVPRKNLAPAMDLRWSTVLFCYSFRENSGRAAAPGDQTGLPREAARVSSWQAAQQPGGPGQEDHRAAETRTERVG